MSEVGYQTSDNSGLSNKRNGDSQMPRREFAMKKIGEGLPFGHPYALRSAAELSLGYRVEGAYDPALIFSGVLAKQFAE